MLDAFVGVLLLALVGGSAGSGGAPVCQPAVSYTDWQLDREVRSFEGAWVVAYRHYQRSVVESCTYATTIEKMVEGPVRLWPAVPHQYLDSVSAPVGSREVTGAPLHPVEGDAYFTGPQVGPRPPGAIPPSGRPEPTGAGTKEPAPVGVWVIAGALGWLIAYRRKLAVGESLALASLLVAFLARSAEAGDSGVSHSFVRPPEPPDPYFNTKLGPVPEHPVLPGWEPQVRLLPPAVDSVSGTVAPLGGPSILSKAFGFATGFVKQHWGLIAMMGTALVTVFGDPVSWVRSTWDRLMQRERPKTASRPPWLDEVAAMAPVPVVTLEGHSREPGPITPYASQPVSDAGSVAAAPKPDPIEWAFARGFTLEAILYYGPRFFIQATEVRFEPWEIAHMNSLAANGLSMGWAFTDTCRADRELAAIKAYIFGFLVGSDSVEAGSAPESYGASAGDVTAGLLAYGDLRDLVLQGYRGATGQEVDRVTVSLALLGLFLDLGWTNGVVPDPADGANAILSGTRVMFKGLPDPVRKTFAGVFDASKNAKDKRTFYQEVREAILWSARNPKTASRMVESGRGLDDLIDVARKTPKVSSALLEQNMLARNPGLVKPQGYAAHHIVAGNHQEAEEARRILEKFGIDINAAENGVFLPHAGRSIGNGEVYHRTLHTDPYFKTVHARLKEAATREEATHILRTIAQELSLGKFPH